MERHSNGRLIGAAGPDDYSPRILWSLSWTLALLAVLAIGLAWVFDFGHMRRNGRGWDVSIHDG